MKRTLVVGATGNIGGHVLSQLVAAGAPVRAFVRNSANASLPAGVEVAQGDLTIPESLDVALDGVDTVFLVWIAPASAALPALERITKRVRRIVYLSAPIKTPHPLFQQPNLGRTLAETIERAIENSGVEWTFLRPGMFGSNALLWWAPQTRAGDVVRWPYLSVQTAPMDPRDIAAVAVRAITEDGHNRAEYVMTGPQSLSQREQIEIIGNVLGRSLRIEELSREEAQIEFPRIMLPFLLNAWAASGTLPAFMANGVEQVTGTPARTFETWVRDHLAEFQGTATHAGGA